MLFSFLTLFFISGAYLSYEILLMRSLSILNWSHYAYMVISLAMLGLGFSGVIVALFDKFFRKNTDKIIWSGCLIFGITIPLSFYINTKLPLNYLYLLWDWHQLFFLIIRYLIYGIPFLIVSILIALFFLKFPHKSNLVYGINLTGSALGIIFSIFMMYLVTPEEYLIFSATLSIAGGFIWGMRKGNSLTMKVFTLLICFVIIFFNINLSNQELSVRVSEYKGLSGLLRLPGTEIISKLHNPMGLVHVLEGKSIRLISGLSIRYKKEIPSQKALTIDGGSPSPIVDSIDDIKDLDFLDYMIFSSGYYVVSKPNTLIVGAGGMIDLLLAQYHNSDSIHIVEMNPNIVKAVRLAINEQTEDKYFKSNVDINIEEARGYLETTLCKYNLIQLNPFGEFSSSAAGVYSQNEDYLNSLESYKLFYNKLAPDGILMLSKWIKTPARDGIKLFATAYEMLEREGIKRPQKHLFLLRNWDIITLLIKRTPFDTDQIKKLVNFSQKRNFDVSYYYGIKENQVNIYNRLPQPVYYQAANKIIDRNKREKFYDSYIFNIVPSTDNKPYFSNFFKWSSLPHLIKTSGKEWIPFSEFGYLSLITTCIQSIIIGFIIIIFPLFALFKRKKTARIFKFDIWVYFIILGFFYMILEISLIQKFKLFLHHPIYSTSIVISSFLLFSGLGSMCSKYFFKHSIKKFQILPFLIIIILGLGYVFYLDNLFLILQGGTIFFKLIISFFIIGPLAFFLGMPFPLGMHIVSPSGIKNIGVAWGYNGYFSVIGAVAAPILAMLIGFKLLSILGCLGYLLALFIWIKVLSYIS